MCKKLLKLIQFSIYLIIFIITTQSANAASLKRYNVTDGLISDTITALASDSSGTLWIGTLDGAMSFDGVSWQKYTTLNGCLKDNAVWTIGIDEFENKRRIWFGTGFGLAVFENGHWTHYIGAYEHPKTKKRMEGNCPIASNIINKIFVVKEPTKKNNTIFIVAGGKLYRFNGEKWSTFDFPSEIIKNSSITTLYAINSNLLWLGTSGSGVIEFNLSNMKATTYTKKEGLPSDYITAIYVDNKNRVFIGSESGLGILEKGVCVTYNYQNSKLVSDYVTCIDKAFYDNIAIATDKGLTLYDGKSFMTPPALLSVTNGQFLWTLNFSSIDSLNYSLFWIGTRGFGLYSYKLSKNEKENLQEDLLRTALSYYEKNLYEQAILNFDEILKIDPDNKQILVYKARSFIKMKNYDRALEVLKYTLEKYQNFKEAILLLGELYELMGDFKSAANVYENLLIYYPNEVDGYVLCAKCFLRMNKYDEAISYYTKAFAINTELPSIYKGLAKCFIAQNNFKKALEISLQLQYKKPDDIENNVQIAKIYVNMHKYVEAEEEAKKILASDENNTYAKSILGLINYEKGNLKEAEKYLTEALSINFKDAATHAILSLVHLENNQIGLAKGSLANAKFIDSSEVMLSYVEGRILESEGHYNDAISYYQQSIINGYNTAMVHYRLANSLKSLEKYDEALKEYHKVLEMDPQFKKADDVKWIISKLTVPTEDDLQASGGYTQTSSSTYSSSSGSSQPSRPSLDDLDF